MTSKLDNALATVRRLPDERQDELADVLLAVSGAVGARYSDTQQEAIEEGLADAQADRFVSDEELESTFRRFGTA